MIYIQHSGKDLFYINLTPECFYFYYTTIEYLILLLITPTTHLYPDYDIELLLKCDLLELTSPHLNQQ